MSMPVETRDARRTGGGPDLERPGEEAPERVPLYPSARAITAQRPYLRKLLLASGLRGAPLDDVLAECIGGAWTSSQRGKFLVSPGVDLEAALRRWLTGIAWRQAAHERERAHHRREVLTPTPWALAPEKEKEASIDPEKQVIAREALRELSALPEQRRAALVGVALGHRATEVARSMEVSRTSVAVWLREGRAELARRLATRAARCGSKRGPVRRGRRSGRWGG